MQEIPTSIDAMSVMIFYRNESLIRRGFAGTNNEQFALLRSYFSTYFIGYVIYLHDKARIQFNQQMNHHFSLTLFTLKNKSAQVVLPHYIAGHIFGAAH